MRRTIFFTLVSFSLLSGIAAHAAGKLYKWVDEHGQTHFGDRIPPQYAKEERKELSNQGTVVKTYERQKTPEEIEEARRLEAIRVEQAELEARQREEDRILMDLYRSVGDIEVARESQIETISAYIRVSEGNRGRQQAELQRLIRQAADHERQGEAVPKKLQEDIDSARQLINKYELEIQERKQEQEKIREEFAQKIDRFNTLTQAR